MVYSVGVHQGALRRSLLRYKYHGEWWRAAELGRLVSNYLKTNSTWFEEFEVLAGVPAYSGPAARRGWDPVRLILEELATLLGASWKVEPDLVVKATETPAMQGLDWSSRQSLATGPLRAALTVPRPQAIGGARVLVFDDVMTEGSTLREVARALRRAGATEVAGLVLGRPTWSDPRELSGPGSRS